MNLELNVKIKTFFQLKFMNQLVDLENSSLDKIDNITIEFPTVKRLLEGVGHCEKHWSNAGKK
jgi:hypothetical protein